MVAQVWTFFSHRPRSMFVDDDDDDDDDSEEKSIKKILVGRFGCDVGFYTSASPQMVQDSMLHSFLPRRIQKNPFMPQVVPQELATIQ